MFWILSAWLFMGWEPGYFFRSVLELCFGKLRKGPGITAGTPCWVDLVHWIWTLWLYKVKNVGGRMNIALGDGRGFRIYLFNRYSPGQWAVLLLLGSTLLTRILINFKIQKVTIFLALLSINSLLESSHSFLVLHHSQSLRSAIQLLYGVHLVRSAWTEGRDRRTKLKWTLFGECSKSCSLSG